MIELFKLLFQFDEYIFDYRKSSSTLLLSYNILFNSSSIHHLALVTEILTGQFLWGTNKHTKQTFMRLYFYTAI